MLRFGTGAHRRFPAVRDCAIINNIQPLFDKEAVWRLIVQMAIYRMEAKIIGREQRGHSVVAASAYRSGRQAPR